MTLALPEGKTVAVAVTPHFDAESLWIARGAQDDEAAMSRGRYGGDVAAPRVLELFESRGVRTSWAIPVHTMRTWPELCMRIAQTHEVFAHGVCHERLSGVDRAREEDLLVKQLRAHEAILGTRPIGYSAPGGIVTAHTLELLEAYGFVWDSSLAGGDVKPYRPARVVSRDPERGTVYGERHTVLEFPTTADQEDWFSFEFFFGGSQGMAEPETVRARWQRMIEWAMQREPGGAVLITVHPQTIARPHRFDMFEGFVDWLVAQPSIWLAPVAEIAAQWTEEP